MNYIINPWWIYLIGIVDVIKVVAGSVMVLSGIAVCVFGGLHISGEFGDASNGYEEVRYNKVKRSINAGNVFYNGLDLQEAEQKYKNAIATAKKEMKLFKICIVICVLSSLITMFMPNKETLISMQVAKFATYENAEMAVDTIKNAVDYIISAIKGVK